MATIVKMPKWGLTMTQGTIVDWLVEEGAEVSEGDMILTVETEKAVDDVGAPASGVLYKIVAPAGSEIDVSGPIALIVESGESLSDAEIDALIKPESAAPAEAAMPAEAGTRRERQSARRDAGGRINASPAAKKLAAALGVELTEVEATGPGGRITSDDVQRAADENVDPSPTEGVATLASGRTVHYLDAGPKSNRPIVFIHGLGGSLSSWQLVMGGLASGHRMTAVDLPGHGGSAKSAPAETDYSVTGIAADVAETLTTGNRKPSILVGHSLGGAVALKLAVDHPDLVAGLVLIDSAALGSSISQELLDLMGGSSGVETARGLLSLFFQDQKLVTDRGIEEMAGFHEDGGWAAQQAVANAAFSGGSQQFGLFSELGSIDKPVLLIWGEHDRVIPLSDAVAALTVFPDGLLKVLPDTGHVPQVERAEAVATAIDRFVRSLDR
ncbi:MAG: alpha/beta fold hydrolase [Thermomicrobiales bacterium]|nr:alpha/beta fold hydrolase [Thermomicrobiales bacterium]